jgi:hypothetical protein
MTKMGGNNLQNPAFIFSAGKVLKSPASFFPPSRHLFSLAQVALFLNISIFAAASLPASGDRAAQLARAAQPPAQNSQQGGQNMDGKAGPQLPGQLQAKPLQIIYEDGELTIDADNVPLSEILSQVRKILGADIQIPPGVAEQRMWVQFGPGPARRILRDLLDITDLDYVIQASETDQDGVLSVSLTARAKGSDSSVPANAVVAAVKRHPQQIVTAPVEYSEPESHAASEATTTSASEPVAPVSSPTSAETRAVAAASLQPSRQGIGPVSTAPLVGSAEQMAQQLQSLYQQRRLQMQQNQKPTVIN